MKLKNAILSVIITIPLFLSSCGNKEPEQEHLEYENAVSTFVGAFNKGDEQSLLSCFTPGAKDEFLLTDKSAISLLDENISDACGKYLTLNYHLNDKTELSEEEIEQIKSSYNASYGLRLNIKKAYSLEVSFVASSVGNATEADMTVITAKTDSGWCICGDVITELF